MKLWRRARKGERCGYCLDHTFREGDPVLLVDGLKRCAAVAKARYGEDVPVPFPEPEIAVAPGVHRPPDFVTAGELARSSRYRRGDAKLRQAGEQE